MFVFHLIKLLKVSSHITYARVAILYNTITQIKVQIIVHKNQKLLLKVNTFQNVTQLNVTSYHTPVVGRERSTFKINKK